MGMLSKAMKKRKKQMETELGLDGSITADTPAKQVVIDASVVFDDSMAIKLHEIASLRGTTIQQLVTAKMTALVNQYENSRILRLEDSMPYGQYRGLNVEDMIRADPRYVNWLASESSVFVLDEEATKLLGELS